MSKDKVVGDKNTVIIAQDAGELSNSYYHSCRINEPKRISSYKRPRVVKSSVKLKIISSRMLW